jgi:hypothetical protein
MRENSPVLMVRRMDITIEPIDYAEYHQGLDGQFDNGTMSGKVNNWNGIQDASEGMRRYLMVI